MKFEDLPDFEPEQSEADASEPQANNPDPAARTTPEAAAAAGDTPQCLANIPPDAEMDDATLTCWNGRRFVRWEAWARATREARNTTPARK